MHIFMKKEKILFLLRLDTLSFYVMKILVLVHSFRRSDININTNMKKILHDLF